MAKKHDAAFRALRTAIHDPSQKAKLASDPLVGSIIKKLSKKDLETLAEVSKEQDVAELCNFPPEQ